MGFSQLRLFPITERGNTGLPTYGTPLSLQTDKRSAEVNSVEISIEYVTKEKVLSADDTEEVKEVVVRFGGTLKVYDVLSSALDSVLGYEIDRNGNVVETVNSGTKKHFGLYFRCKNSRDVKFQKYIYDVEFLKPNETHATDSGDGTATIDLKFNGKIITADGKSYPAFNVYEGKIGYIAEGSEPITMQFPVFNQSANG